MHVTHIRAATTFLREANGLESPEAEAGLTAAGGVPATQGRVGQTCSDSELIPEGTPGLGQGRCCGA